MKNTKLYILALCLPLLMSFTLPQGWITFESTTENFRVLFPDQPESTEDLVETAIGPLVMHNFIYSPKGTTTAYMVMSTEYPADLLSSDNPDLLDDFFRKAVDGGVQQTGGKLVSEKTASLGAYPGRAYSINLEDGKAVMEARVYLVKNKLYLLQATEETATANRGQVERFLNSFALVSQ